MIKEEMEKEMLQKLIGADIELGNFFTGSDHPGGTGVIASRMLLSKISGIPADGIHHCDWQDYQKCSGRHNKDFSHHYSHSGHVSDGTGRARNCNPQDVDRKFIVETGGGAYIDMNHLEICLPEVLSARDYVKYNRALHELAARACKTVNAYLTEQHIIHLNANNSDGLSNSYGSHLNFLISRRSFDNIFNRKLQHLLFLASYQASSIVITGQGKVGSENGHEWTDFQLSQRADFFETIVGQQTTFNRPLVNSRDESHSREDMARLHCIFFDNALCQISNYLKVGIMQIILSMLECEFIKNELILDDTLRAVSDWSHDPSLMRKACTLDGKYYTAVQHQLAVFEEAEKFISSCTVAEEIIPDVHTIIHLWGDTLNLLESRDFTKLRSRLDWVLKLQILEGVRKRHLLSWRSPQMKHLDLLYSSLDRERGLFWQYERKGAVEKIVSEEEIEKCTGMPPDNTRAWFRSYLLRHALREMIEIESIKWDSIVFKLYERGDFGHSFTRRVRVDMDNPLGFTRSELGPLTKSASSLHELIRKIGEEINAFSNSIYS